MAGLEMTVSCIHGHTKCALYKCKFPACVITAFTSITSTEATIQTAGFEAMQITCGCGDTHLERARYLRFQKQASKGKIDPTAYHQRKMQQHSIPFVYISKLQYGNI